MEQLNFLPKLKLTKAQLQTIIKERDYESLEVNTSDGQIYEKDGRIFEMSNGITYKIDGRIVEIIDTEKIETRGGSRPGCGRKPVHPGIKRVQTTISVTQETREKIRLLAKNNNIRIGRVIDRVVEELYNQYYHEEVRDI